MQNTRMNDFLSFIVSQFYEGLRVQDLRRLKDMLIVETADMLQAPLFTAEALLRAHGTPAILTLIYLCSDLLYLAKLKKY